MDKANILNQLKKIDYKIDGIHTFEFPNLGHDVFISKSSGINKYRKEVIQDGERPDMMSLRLYGDSSYYILFFLLNPHLRDGARGWPMSLNSHAEYIQKKYDGYISLAATIGGNMYKVGDGSAQGRSATVLHLDPRFFKDFSFYVLDHGTFRRLDDLELIEYSSHTDSMIFRSGAISNVSLRFSGLGNETIYISGPTEWEERFEYVKHSYLEAHTHDGKLLLPLDYMPNLSYLDLLESPYYYYTKDEIIPPLTYKKLLRDDPTNPIISVIKNFRVIDYENLIREKLTALEVPSKEAAPALLSEYRKYVSK
jgi:hypothetical protein